MNTYIKECISCDMKIDNGSILFYNFNYICSICGFEVCHKCFFSRRVKSSINENEICYQADKLNTCRYCKNK
jgi:hypothetical protein